MQIRSTHTLKRLKKIKMNNKVFTFNFDLQPAHNLRAAINEKDNLSIDKEHELHKKKVKNPIPYFAWDRICAIMDRLEDTLGYINLMELGNCRSRNSAFDFFEFINNAYIVIEGIRIIGQIFALDNAKIEAIEKSQDVFGDVLNAGGTDGQFFKYIRSLCAVHPFNTTDHPAYMKNSDLHCCPFVVWTHCGIGLCERDKRDLSVHVYTSRRGDHIQDIPLYVGQFEAYINKWITLISDVIVAIQNYNESVYEEYRKQPLKGLTDFNNEVEYVFHLKQEYCKRFGDTIEYIFDKLAFILEGRLENKENAEKLEKYKNAIRYALPFMHRSLEGMAVEGFEYTGIIGENYTETNLLIELEHPDMRSEDLSKYHYNLSKVYYLESDNYGYWDKDWARQLVKAMGDFLNKYVVFTNEETDSEIVLLVDLAVYLHALEQECMLNRSIPNDLQYREKLLTDDEIGKLNKQKAAPEELPEEIVVRFTDTDGKVWKEIKIEPDKD